MKLLTLVYVFCLFYVFIPGNLFKLPIKTSKMNLVLLHALLFSVVLSVSYPYVESIQLYEPMTENKQTNQPPEKNQTIQPAPEKIATSSPPIVTAMSSSTPPPSM